MVQKDSSQGLLGQKDFLLKNLWVQRIFGSASPKPELFRNKPNKYALARVCSAEPSISLIIFVLQ